tara:strand:- start:670 stop:1107 length:438 start_codon:yes stop_codon:yes gene_type:complete
MADEAIKWKSGCREMTEEEYLSIIVKGEDVTKDIDYGDRIVIDMPRALEHAHQIELDCMPLHEYTIEHTNIVFPDVTEDNWREEGQGVHHVLGRVDLTLKLGDVTTFMWRNPEDSLGPSEQVRLGQLLLVMLKGYPLREWMGSRC